MFLGLFRQFISRGRPENFPRLRLDPPPNVLFRRGFIAGCIRSAQAQGPQAPGHNASRSEGVVCLTLRQKDAVVFWATDEPTFFLRYVLIATCVTVLWHRFPLCDTKGGEVMRSFIALFLIGMIPHPEFGCTCTTHGCSSASAWGVDLVLVRGADSHAQACIPIRMLVYNVVLIGSRIYKTPPPLKYRFPGLHTRHRSVALSCELATWPKYTSSARRDSAVFMCCCPRIAPPLHPVAGDAASVVPTALPPACDGVNPGLCKGRSF